MAPRAPAPLERLARLMEERTRELDMTWQDVAAAGGPAVRTLNNIRNGRSVPDHATRPKLDAALRWQPGSVRAILDGGDPVPLDGPAPQPAGDWRPEALGAGYSVTEIARAQKLKDDILRWFGARPAGVPPDQAGDFLFPDDARSAAAWDAGWAASGEDPAVRAEQVAWVVALADVRRAGAGRGSRGA